MKRNILFIITAFVVAFIFMGGVNADTIVSPTAYCGDFPKDGDSLITECSPSGDDKDLYTTRLITWYKGDLNNSTTTNPGVDVGTTGVYESGYKYYLKMGFKPKAGNEFMNYVNFHIIGLSDATVIDVVDGEYIVVFEFTVHHVVHFETYGGTTIDDIVVTDWCSFDMPDDPVKDGNTFLGWYEDPEFEHEYWGSCVEESFTLYAKFVSNENFVSEINVSLAGPVAGTVIALTQGIDPEWGYAYEDQDPTPIVTTAPGAHYSVDYTFWVEGICTPESMQQDLYPCDTRIEGTILEDTYYYAEIGIVTDEGYSMNSSNLSIKINGQDPDEVFAVYNNNFTRFIAKVKSITLSTMINANKSSIDFGYSYPNLDNDEYLALTENITITNTGITTVTLGIDNPTAQGFGSNWFDSSKELAPGESMQIGLIPHPSYISSKVPGTYNANYLITATNVEDPTETFQVSIPAKIVLLERDISKTKITGIVDKTYNRYSQTQKGLVLKHGDKTLVLDTDYKVTYKNNLNAGTATMTIIGLGKYANTSVVKTFKIYRAKQPLSLKYATKTAYASTLKKKSVLVKPITIVKKQGTLVYSKLGGSAKLTINKTTGKVTVKKGTKKGTYKIRVKVLAKGNTNYNAGYKVVVVTVKVK